MTALYLMIFSFVWYFCNVQALHWILLLLCHWTRNKWSQKSISQRIRNSQNPITNLTFLNSIIPGETLSSLDTKLMPMLQHVRVASKFFLDYEIPHELMHLWRYMEEMYKLDAFRRSCPADQDIIQGFGRGN